MGVEHSLPRAIRDAREAQGMTQQDLATRAGFNSLQTVSDIERGRRDVKAWEAVRIAQVLRTSVDVLLGLADAPRARVLWRRGSPGASGERESRLLERARRYGLLEAWCGLPPAEPLPDYAFEPVGASFADVARLASWTGQALDLGSRPASALANVLQERYRVKVFAEPLGDGESAASVRDGFGAAVLVNASEAPWRQNFSLAHELFHLVTWTSVAQEMAKDPEGGEPYWLESLEKFANSFAANLLLPGEEVLAQFDGRVQDGRIPWVDLIEIAREFDVSTAALLWRLVNLRRMAADQVRDLLSNARFGELDRSTMVGRWSRDDLPSADLPERFVRLAWLAHQKGHLSRAKLAEFLEIPLGDLPELDDDAGLATEATLAPA